MSIRATTPILSRLTEIVGNSNVVADPAQLSAYEIDGQRPGARNMQRRLVVSVDRVEFRPVVGGVSGEAETAGGNG